MSATLRDTLMAVLTLAFSSQHSEPPWKIEFHREPTVIALDLIGVPRNLRPQRNQFVDEHVSFPPPIQEDIKAQGQCYARKIGLRADPSAANVAMYSVGRGGWIVETTINQPQGTESVTLRQNPDGRMDLKVAFSSDNHSYIVNVNESKTQLAMRQAGKQTMRLPSGSGAVKNLDPQEIPIRLNAIADCGMYGAPPSGSWHVAAYH